MHDNGGGAVGKCPISLKTGSAEDRHETIQQVEALALKFVRSASLALEPWEGEEEYQASLHLCEGYHAQIVEDGRYSAGTQRLRRLLLAPRHYRRLARLFGALDLVHSLNLEGRTATQRELYYRSQGQLFKSQTCVNAGLRDACGALQKSRLQLGVHVTEKGLVGGRISFLHFSHPLNSSGTSISTGTSSSSRTSLLLRRQQPQAVDSLQLLPPGSQFGFEDGGLLSTTPLGPSSHASPPEERRPGPRGAAISEALLSDPRLALSFHGAKAILVVEKDTFFQHLLQSAAFTALPLVLVTGRGYPDVLTRRFLQRLHRERPETPQFYMGDFDPDGVAIFLLYRESCPWLLWRGLFAGDLSGSPAGLEGSAPSLGLPLKPRDRALRASLLARKEVVANEPIRKEIEGMEQKFELESLIEVYGPERLCMEFLPAKLGLSAAASAGSGSSSTCT